MHTGVAQDAKSVVVEGDEAQGRWTPLYDGLALRMTHARLHSESGRDADSHCPTQVSDVDQVAGAAVRQPGVRFHAQRAGDADHPAVFELDRLLRGRDWAGPGSLQLDELPRP